MRPRRGRPEGTARRRAAVPAADARHAPVAGPRRSRPRRDERKRAPLRPRSPEPLAEPGASRRAVRCPHFPDCVGCPLVGTPYGEQLRAKEAALRDALAAHPALHDVRPERIAGSPEPFGYRNQAKLVFRRRRTAGGGHEVMLGVYRPGSHGVVPADRCAVHDPGLRRVLTVLRREVEAQRVAIFDERTRQGQLRYALGRRSRATGAVHLTLVSATDDLKPLDRLLARLRDGEPSLEAAFVCVNATPGNTLLSSDIRKRFGPRALVEHFGRIALESRPDAFVQANVAIATRIYATAEEWLAPRREDAVLDVFCGVGGLGLALAPRLSRVLGIEASAAAVECANGNAKRAHASHVRAVVGGAEDAAAIARGEALSPAPGGDLLVVVNPPRRGLTEAARAAVVELAPRAVLYLSCDPSTLARDLADLAARGFAVRRVRPFDMMPQTPHVETLALLERL